MSLFDPVSCVSIVGGLTSNIRMIRDIVGKKKFKPNISRWFCYKHAVIVYFYKCKKLLILRGNFNYGNSAPSVGGYSPPTPKNWV